MEVGNQKVVTFLSQYGALSFKRKYPDCTLKPAPRSLSSSCGTAAFIDGDIDTSILDRNAEAVYVRHENKWKEIWRRKD